MLGAQPPPVTAAAAMRPFGAGRWAHAPLKGYALAVASVAIGLGLREAADGWLPTGFPFLTFFPAIVVTTYLAGLRPGLLSLLLSAVVARYFLIPPLHSFTVTGPASAALAFFVFVGLIDIGLIYLMQRALDRLDLERRRSARLYEEQRVLFQELQHRVANNLAFVASLLQLQQRGIRADPTTAPKAIEDAIARIETMGRVHRRLYDPALSDADPEVHLRQVCTDLVDSSGHRNIRCKVSMPGARFGIDRLLPLSLLVSELVTNSLKHGFKGRDGGELSLTLESGDDGGQVLVVRDDGVGLPAGHDAGQTTGLGLRIMRSLAGQLGGSISMASDGGTVTRIHLPAAA